MRPIWAGVVVTVTALGLSACSGAHEQVREHTTARTRPAGRPTAGVDVPSLLNLSFDEMSQRVGPSQPLPAGFSDPTVAPMPQHNAPLDSMALFRRSGVALVVAYDYKTRRVNDLLLLGNNENELMSRANLQLGADRYLVLPVFRAHQPTELMGLRVLTTALNQ
ncbi:hypothetical protein [Hymenobacter convexus]|uniref:hypothetical protein n=1 Tax=Hymenobacter sp. CA1UV-4 TaxID=3063782 RepID=UPI0027136740|nr:hypothetical protein [Hymenobacter sp. CA1UV-4]MDO7853860.1 hypothetical protein [Hymenobacter sp. CA1UV-4]